MSDAATGLTRLVWEQMSAGAAMPAELEFTGTGALPSVFPVTEFASATIACAGLAVAELLRQCGASAPSIVVDRRMSSLWFRSSIRPVGWSPPPPWDPIAGDYLARDGWIRLHTNAPKHRQAALQVLQTDNSKDEVARAVSAWQSEELEAAVVEHGGCAARMRSLDDWKVHPQGIAVNAEPLVHIANVTSGSDPTWRVPFGRPLQAVRVLDLTRVLAGPVATRFLAGFGAQVLRLDPSDWEEPGIIPEVTLGKRCARLDLKSANGRAVFESLLSRADILVHGYRPGALDELGYDAHKRHTLAPGLIDISLDAYGWHGPWSRRRGFDSLVQMSSGIADAGMRDRLASKPVPLPVQALDHATGYLMAAAALRAMTDRLRHGRGTQARLSLARTATFLIEHQARSDQPALTGDLESDWSAQLEHTEWGLAQRARSPLDIRGTPMQWDLPARSLGSAAACWPEG